MSKKSTSDNVVSLDQARALRSTVELLHSSDMRKVIKEGASAEFTFAVAPALRKLLDAKGADREFQNSLIELLEKAYADAHLEKADNTNWLEELLGEK